MERGKEIILIASVGNNLELGSGGNLCWHIRQDLQRFRRLTSGHTVVMGRKTWESLPVKPLPGRTNIIVTSQPSFALPEGNVLAVSSLEDAVARAPEGERVFIIGGATVYREFLPLASTLMLTRIFDDAPEADTFFPDFSAEEWVLSEASDVMDNPGGPQFRYETYRRR